MTGETIPWDDAIDTGNFVKFKKDPDDKAGEEYLPKIIVITNWDFVEVDKFGKKQIEFTADCIEDDGEKTSEKTFSTMSSRFKTKLRPILETRDNTDRVTLNILKMGEKFDTKYSVKEIKPVATTAANNPPVADVKTEPVAPATE